MKTKTLWILIILLPVLTIVLSGSIAYGEDAVQEAYREYEKAFDDYCHQQSLLGIIRVLLVGIAVISGFIYIRKTIDKEKKVAGNAVRDIVRTELDHRIDAAPKLQTCENCGRTIAKLEKSYPFEKHVVCRECHKRLKDPRMRLLTRLPAHSDNSTQA